MRHCLGAVQTCHLQSCFQLSRYHSRTLPPKQRQGISNRRKGVKPASEGVEQVFWFPSHSTGEHSDIWRMLEKMSCSQCDIDTRSGGFENWVPECPALRPLTRRPLNPEPFAGFLSANILCYWAALSIGIRPLGSCWRNVVMEVSLRPKQVNSEHQTQSASV